MKRLVRVWKELDIADVEKFLIVVGELSAECFACHDLGIDARSEKCPHCGVYFKYMGFRRKLEPAYLLRLKEEFPERSFIDFDDFKKAVGKQDARRLLDL